MNGDLNGKLTFEALKPKEFDFELIVEDEAGNRTQTGIQFNVLDNQLPVARLALSMMEGSEIPGHVSIDGAASEDMDANWGGGLDRYRFILDGFYETETSRPGIEYIFPEPELYTIRLQVRDNDGTWSEEVTDQILIEE